MRAGNSSRAESAAAIVGLIVLSALMLDVFYSSSFANPTTPRNGNAGPAPPVGASPLDGTLVVSVTSNKNTTDRFAPPTNVSSGADGVPVVVTFLGAFPPSRPERLWVTNAHGLAGCIECLPVGQYVLTIRYYTLNMSIPASVFAHNQTLVRVVITGRVYHLIYSQEPGLLVTPSSAQYTMFAEVTSSLPVANASQPVFLTVSKSASGAGYSVNATVISLDAPSMGTQWLQLGVPSTADLVDATSISMTAWTYSTNATVGGSTYGAFSLAP